MQRTVQYSTVIEKKGVIYTQQLWATQRHFADPKQLATNNLKKIPTAFKLSENSKEKS